MFDYPVFSPERTPCREAFRWIIKACNGFVPFRPLSVAHLSIANRSKWESKCHLNGIGVWFRNRNRMHWCCDWICQMSMVFRIWWRISIVAAGQCYFHFISIFHTFRTLLFGLFLIYDYISGVLSMSDCGCISRWIFFLIIQYDFHFLFEWNETKASHPWRRTKQQHSPFAKLAMI